MPTTPKRKTKKPNLAKIQRQVVDYIKHIENENKELKTNPESVVGQVIPQLREAISQNKRLSVLAASLIEAAGGSITVSKALLESFESKVLSIKWEVPEGTEDATEATDFVFKYEAVTPQEASSVAPEVTVTSTDEETTVEVADAVQDAAFDQLAPEEETPSTLEEAPVVEVSEPDVIS